MTSNVTIAYVSFISGAALAIRDAIGGGAKDSAIIADVLQMISFHRELALVTFNFIIIFALVNLNVSRYQGHQANGHGTLLVFTISTPLGLCKVC